MQDPHVRGQPAVCPCPSIRTRPDSIWRLGGSQCHDTVLRTYSDRQRNHGRCATGRAEHQHQPAPPQKTDEWINELCTKCFSSDKLSLRSTGNGNPCDEGRRSGLIPAEPRPLSALYALYGATPFNSAKQKPNKYGLLVAPQRIGICRSLTMRLP